MSKSNRRRFMQTLTGAAACASSGLLEASLFGGSRAGSEPIRVYVDSRRTISPLDRNLFGSFLEHLGRAIYEGVYDPGSKLADANGFRKDVMEEVRHLGVPIIRYPGGNFVSGYNWLDGVGPKEKRPAVLDKAWNSLNSNQFGTNEFLTWCKAVGTQPLMGMNFGTGTAEQAAALVEYCNVEKGTKWSDLRREHGYAEPHNVKYWCMGNEMDGPWQIGHMSAVEYGMKAADAARQMRVIDPNLKLIACGSSGPGMPAYLEWDRQVLEQCYPEVDAISLHRYFGNSHETGGDSSKYVALNLLMDRQIEEVAAVCDIVRARQKSPKKLWLSFDEWNVWYRANSGDAVNGHRQSAPHLLEEVYNLEDALLVGGLVNSLMRHADRVRLACLAQLINVIAPIMTNETGLYRQTIYYPYSWGLEFARGSVLELLVDSSAYDVAGIGPVAHLDAAGCFDGGTGKTALFLLNRDLSKPHEVEIVWEDSAPSRVASSWVITGDDLKASNSFAAPNRVAPQAFAKPATANGKTRLELPPRSYTVMQWSA
ncbi:MAG TPA: alpha-N-arabinofuranosidase [Candidatus Acidoferrum sp.]|nr:alpha-N-arabinofuranosidase [Candidatus Acidoferrum sp.]